MTTLALSRRFPLAIAFAALAVTACEPSDDTDEADPGTGTTSGTEAGSEGRSDGDSTGAQGQCQTLSFEDFEGSPVFPTGCYRIDLLVAKSDGTVTFEAGAEVGFGPNAGLNIFDSAGLIAAGTAEDPVVFAGQVQDRGSWQGIGISSRGPDNQLVNLLLSDAGGAGAALVLANGRVALDAVTIQDNAGFGLIADDASEIAMENCVVTANEQLMQIGLEAVEAVEGSNSLVGNDEDILHAEGSSLEDAVWTVSEVPVHPSAELTVNGAWTLMPGVTVAMRQNAAITVRSTATISAEGSAEAPVTFTGQVAEPGYWKGLTVESTSPSNGLTYTRLEYGGSSPWTGDSGSAGLVFLGDGGKLRIEDSVLSHSASAALRARAGADIEGFVGNTIENNAETLALQVDLVGDVAASNAFVDNAESFVRVQRPNSPNNRLITPQSWSALEVPYRITYVVSIEAPLTLEAGTTVQFGQGEWVEISGDGTFTAEGTADAPVTFEGGEALAGYWKGLHFQTVAKNNVLSNVTIRHAGESPWSGDPESVAAIYLGALQIDGSIEIVDSTLTDNDGNGLFVRQGSTAACTNVSIDVSAPWSASAGPGTSTCG